MTIADISGRAEAALETFAKEPFVFALKPVVKRVLQGIASSKPSPAQVNPHMPLKVMLPACSALCTLPSPIMQSICNGNQTTLSYPLLMQTDVTAPMDKAYFRELEAIYMLRLLLLSCTSSLETCAYELQDASAVLTAKLQSMPKSS